MKQVLKSKSSNFSKINYWILFLRNLVVLTRILN